MAMTDIYQFKLSVDISEQKYEKSTKMTHIAEKIYPYGQFDKIFFETSNLNEACDEIYWWEIISLQLVL